MADVVIVVGTKRGNEAVPAIEIKQMVGRAGRKHGGDACLAHVIVEDERAADIQSSLEQGTNMEVKSPFGTTDGLYFHLMPEIAAGRITDVITAESWFSRSLAASQGVKVKFQKVFDKMEKEGAITQVHGVLRPTKVGIIASDLYFHPGDVQSWKDNFTRLFELGLENDNAAIAWSLGTRTHTKCQGDFGSHRYVIEEFKSALPMGLDLEEGTVIQVVLWWCAMGGPPSGRLRNQMLELKDDIGRIKRALVRLDKEVTKWGRVEFFDDLEIMVRKGVTVDLVNLCKLPGITKGRADFLYNNGARDAESIEGILSNIEDELDEPFLEALKGIIDGVRRTSRGSVRA
jgi:replicative superfamily II helicase